MNKWINDFESELRQTGKNQANVSWFTTGTNLATSVFTVVTMDTGSRDMSSSLTTVSASQGRPESVCLCVYDFAQTFNKNKIQGSNIIYNAAAGPQK